MGKYEGQIFGFPEKKDLWENWDPNSPRSETNFNPFERNADGNACDCSGYFPGEGKYPDPARPDVDFAAMMAEKTAMAEIEANPKAGTRRARRAASTRLAAASRPFIFTFLT